MNTPTIYKWIISPPVDPHLTLTRPIDHGTQVMLSFCAGSLTGSFAEVITNPPDQVKTMTQAGVHLGLGRQNEKHRKWNLLTAR